jgi:hypothetical protein
MCERVEAIHSFFLLFFTRLVVFSQVISKQLNFLRSQTACTVRFISPVAILDLLCSFSVQDSLQHTGMGRAKVVHIRSLVCLLTLQGSRT